MIELNDKNFEEEIKKSEKPILVDFWAPWCHPCNLLGPILEKLSEELKEVFVLAKINLDESPFIARKFSVDRIPTVMLLKDGKAVSQFIGLRPETEIKKWLEENLKDSPEEKDGLIKEYEEYAVKNGFKLNPDRKAVEGLARSLLEREKKLGFKYCPCRRVTGNQEEDKKIICPCLYHLEEIEKDGRCFCGLFVK